LIDGVRAYDQTSNCVTLRQSPGEVAMTRSTVNDVLCAPYNNSTGGSINLQNNTAGMQMHDIDLNNIRVYNPSLYSACFLIDNTVNTTPSINIHVHNLTCANSTGYGASTFGPVQGVTIDDVHLINVTAAFYDNLDTTYHGTHLSNWHFCDVANPATIYGGGYVINNWVMETGTACAGSGGYFVQNYGQGLQYYDMDTNGVLANPGGYPVYATPNFADIAYLSGSNRFALGQDQYMDSLGIVNDLFGYNAYTSTFDFNGPSGNGFVNGTWNSGSALVSGDFGIVAVNTPTSLTYTNSATGGSLTGNTAYYYRVSAINAHGETLASTETSTTTATGTNTNAIKLCWNGDAEPGNTGYRVYGSTAGAEKFIAATGQNVSCYTDTGSVSPSGSLPSANTTLGTMQVNGIGFTGPWAQTTPTVTCASGTPTTITSALRVNTMGKHADVNLVITDTTNGTCAGGLLVTAPFSVKSASDLICGDPISGISGWGILSAGSGVIEVISATGGTFAVTGHSVQCSGTVEMP
jgi:hypothetical protein